MEKKIKYEKGEIVKTGINKKNKKYILINNGEEEFMPFFSNKTYEELEDVINECKVGDKVIYQKNIQQVNPNKSIIWLNYLEIKEHAKEELEEIYKEPKLVGVKNKDTVNEIDKLNISLKIVELFYNQYNSSGNIQVEPPSTPYELTKDILNVKNKLFKED